ncbi:MAG: hypothetical protein ABIP55_07775 [Tepidisphaeraceae bacterium]
MQALGPKACPLCRGRLPTLIYVDGEPNSSMPAMLTDEGKCRTCGRDAGPVHIVWPDYLDDEPGDDG